MKARKRQNENDGNNFTGWNKCLCLILQGILCFASNLRHENLLIQIRKYLWINLKHKINTTFGAEERVISQKRL